MIINMCSTRSQGLWGLSRRDANLLCAFTCSGQNLQAPWLLHHAPCHMCGSAIRVPYWGSFSQGNPTIWGLFWGSLFSQTPINIAFDSRLKKILCAFRGSSHRNPGSGSRLFILVDDLLDLHVLLGPDHLARLGSGSSRFRA